MQWKRIISGSVLLYTAVVSAQTTPAWKKMADFTGDPRSACSTFSFSGYGYVGCGYDGEDFRRSFYLYEPVTDNWTKTESLGGTAGAGLDRNTAASFTIGTKGYIGTGQGGSPFLGDFWEYNSTSDTWEMKAGFGGTARRGAIGFSAYNNGYIGLGQDADGMKNDLWAYDTTNNTWSQVADFIGTPRRFASCFVMDGKAYVGLGDDGAFAGDFYKYDAAANWWYYLNDFGGSPRYSATSFAVNGKGYVLCGYDTTLHNMGDFWEYTPASDTWLQLDDFPGGKRANASAFVIDTLAYVCMGYDTSFLADLWLWGDTTELDPIDTTISIQNTLPDFSFQVSPNPTSDILSFSVSDQAPGQEALQVYDLSGKDVTENVVVGSVSISGSEKTFRIDIRELPPGTYLILLKDAQFCATAKCIKL